MAHSLRPSSNTTSSVEPSIRLTFSSTSCLTQKENLTDTVRKRGEINSGTLSQANVRGKWSSQQDFFSKRITWKILSDVVVCLRTWNPAVWKSPLTMLIDPFVGQIQSASARYSSRLLLEELGNQHKSSKSCPQALTAWWRRQTSLQVAAWWHQHCREWRMALEALPSDLNPSLTIASHCGTHLFLSFITCKMGIID